MQKKKTKTTEYFYLLLRAVQTEEEPISLLRELFGGSYNFRKGSKEGYKPWWEWSLSGTPAVLAFEEMQPYIVGSRMVEKYETTMKFLAEVGD